MFFGTGAVDQIFFFRIFTIETIFTSDFGFTW
jgi:hypothetical protein